MYRYVRYLHFSSNIFFVWFAWNLDYTNFLQENLKIASLFPFLQTYVKKCHIFSRIRRWMSKHVTWLLSWSLCFTGSSEIICRYKLQLYKVVSYNILHCSSHIYNQIFFKFSNILNIGNGESIMKTVVWFLVIFSTFYTSLIISEVLFIFSNSYIFQQKRLIKWSNLLYYHDFWMIMNYCEKSYKNLHVITIFY